LGENNTKSPESYQKAAFRDLFAIPTYVGVLLSSHLSLAEEGWGEGLLVLHKFFKEHTVINFNFDKINAIGLT